MQHRHMFTTGKSRGWRVGCSSSDQPIMCQKRRLGNKCKKGFSPIGDYVGKHKRLTGLPLRPNAMNCGFMPQGKRELILSPLQLGTAGLTLSEQINNTTLNILYEFDVATLSFLLLFLGFVVSLLPFCLLCSLSLGTTLRFAPTCCGAVGVFLRASVGFRPLLAPLLFSLVGWFGAVLI